MKGIKNVMIIGHKPAHTPPDSHHPAINQLSECSRQLKVTYQRAFKFMKLLAHNHIMAKSSNGHWFVSGAGGRSHHEASNSSAWPFVNNEDYGYLQIKINNTDGKVLSSHFYGLDGRLIH